MKGYPEYQDSGVDWVGQIPDHWNIKRFKNLFSIKKDIAGTLGFDVLSITQQGIKVKDIESGAGQVASDYKKYQKVNAGDFAMNHMDLLTGYVDISKHDGVTSPDYRVFTLEEKAANKSYYLYLLQLCYTNKIFYPLGQGAAHIGRWRLPSHAFKEFRAPLPPEKEQQDIARFLERETDRIDKLIGEKQNFIKLLKEKRQALISHVVTKGLDPNVKMKESGIEWFGDVPEHWVVCALKRTIALIESGTSVNAANTPANANSYGVLKTSCVYTGEFNWRKNKTVLEEETGRVSCPVKIGSLIVSRMNAPDLVGAAGFVDGCPENIYLPDRLWQIMLNNKASAEFVHYWTQTRFYRNQVMVSCAGTSSSMQNLSQDEFKSFSIAIPPIREQGEIVTFIKKRLSTLDELQRETPLSIELLKEHRTALISAAVTGKIDVRD